MKNKILDISVVVLFAAVLMMTGCASTQVEYGSADIELTDNISESNSGEAEEHASEEIQYYDSLDNHTQLLYNAFISSDWNTASDILAEFKKSSNGRVAVYETPTENLFLIIEYMPEVRSWQAYLGEISEEKKEGNGVMVSRCENGYSHAGVYVGKWSNNMPNGEGILSDSLNDIEYIFEGSFIDGKLDSTVRVYGLETPELYVDWDTISPQFYIDDEWDYSDLTFDKGKPIPATIEVVDQYIAISEETARELSWFELENDGQYYYRIYDDNYNYILSIGAKAPADGVGGNTSFIYGRLFDSNGGQATYGVACYTTNRIDT